ncbi:MAG: hypothetical protein WCQ50_18475 [Spirochaetota bacterium]
MQYLSYKIKRKAWAMPGAEFERDIPAEKRSKRQTFPAFRGWKGLLAKDAASAAIDTADIQPVLY